MDGRRNGWLDEWLIDLIVFAGGSEEHEQDDVLEAVDPLLPLRPLASNVDLRFIDLYILCRRSVIFSDINAKCDTVHFLQNVHRIQTKRDQFTLTVLMLG